MYLGFDYSGHFLYQVAGQELYFDIDYHYKYSFIKNYDDYTKKIINVIIKVLNKALLRFSKTKFQISYSDHLKIFDG